jgi:hypothetical protein
MVIRRTTTRSLQEIIKEFLKENRLDGKLKERELIRNWENVTGKMVSRSTHNIYLKDRTLFVEIRSSVIKNEISMIREGLVKALNDSVGQNLIDEIRIK